jgi:hypothetical protein
MLLCSNMNFALKSFFTESFTSPSRNENSFWEAKCRHYYSPLWGWIATLHNGLPSTHNRAQHKHKETASVCTGACFLSYVTVERRAPLPYSGCSRFVLARREAILSDGDALRGYPQAFRLHYGDIRQRSPPALPSTSFAVHCSLINSPQRSRMSQCEALAACCYAHVALGQFYPKDTHYCFHVRYALWLQGA